MGQSLWITFLGQFAQYSLRRYLGAVASHWTFAFRPFSGQMRVQVVILFPCRWPAFRLARLLKAAVARLAVRCGAAANPADKSRLWRPYPNVSLSRCGTFFVSRRAATGGIDVTGATGP